MKSKWIDLLSSNDAEKVWEELFHIVSNHSSVRQLYAMSKMSYPMLMDIYTDLTQDLFLRLYLKDRLQFYLDANYTDEKIEQELYRFEIPNLISEMIRAQTPESYRIARRISILLKTQSEFQHYPQPVYASEHLNGIKWTSGKSKLALRVYGLRAWSANKPIKGFQQMRDRIKDVAIRMRDTRRTGRGSGSQIIISNVELSRLITDIFKAIDSPADVRSIRSMAISKMMVEDTSFVSIDAEAKPSQAMEKDSSSREPADDRPTPEEILIGKEMSLQVEDKVTSLFEMLGKAVRDKPKRLAKLLQIVWHCYFNSPPASQSSIASLMGISDSLVTHYRKIFDETIRSLDLNADELPLLNDAIRERLSKAVKKAEDCSIRHREVSDNRTENETVCAAYLNRLNFSAASGD